MAEVGENPLSPATVKIEMVEYFYIRRIRYAYYNLRGREG